MDHENGRTGRDADKRIGFVSIKRSVDEWDMIDEEVSMQRKYDSSQDSRYDSARERALSLPLEQLDPGHPELFHSNTHWPYFDRLRNEDPVHYTRDSMFGPYWSITKYEDIIGVEANHAVFSSAAALGGFTMAERAPEQRRERPRGGERANRDRMIGSRE
jgi:hypothetical protein